MVEKRVRRVSRNLMFKHSSQLYIFFCKIQCIYKVIDFGILYKCAKYGLLNKYSMTFSSTDCASVAVGIDMNWKKIPDAQMSCHYCSGDSAGVDGRLNAPQGWLGENTNSWLQVRVYNVFFRLLNSLPCCSLFCDSNLNNTYIY